MQSSGQSGARGPSLPAMQVRRRLGAVAVVALLVVGAGACRLDGGTVDTGKSSGATAQNVDAQPARDGRVVRTTVRKRERIPQPTRTRKTTAMRTGVSRVARPGRPGLRLRVYRITKQGGVVTQRKVLSGKVLRRPVPRLLLVGAADHPSVPQNAPCDHNYAGCVPFASDIDCAGKGGDGPGYLRHPVRVTGIDVYDLDRDHNGVACG